MSATVTCVLCRGVFWQEPDGSQAESFVGHDCRSTKPSKIRPVSDEQWGQITARLNHPSSWTPDGAA